ncbi:3-oxoacyl-[acyl-carrier-protein] reductase [Wickerhamomyces ciferrii]|uniref:3-oxoacyl-[acyl-carrier-protein] reductase n=1 Tax=Wickerhamomyces ciferrii (strain ATCC 14091 / BCRC 22168 / CBS 111 / JCM 3599 / NBRC 0793 / NRRL Y-1031 F-60-10) TaxID=1206466 RepID=K0KCQ1_WICCF|nr:3-oxoacyl-[acyl-carrier-protein] reductase [Wickerhamomyces ciferrii]CCH42855.1 3-oxoacyl-[acyl-carrier-protein] reductase [Wickerhamomyces ciferrii]
MGKVFFISGATRGIGLQLATQLSQADSSNTIIATARDPTTSTGLNELASKNKNVYIISLDISSEESINGIDEQISSLVSNTGIDVYISNGAICESAPISKLNRQVHIDHYLTNVLGPLQIINILYKYLVKAPTKQIFLLSSIAGQVADFVPIATGAYGQSKAALNHSALQLSLQYKDEGFTVVPLHPGIVDTSLADNIIKSLPEDLSELAKAFIAQLISPEESASGIIGNIINKVTVEDSGKFYKFDGTTLSY